MSPTRSRFLRRHAAVNAMMMGMMPNGSMIANRLMKILVYSVKI